MKPSILMDHIIHNDHIHWCDLEANGLKTCETIARQEHIIAGLAETVSMAVLALLVGYIIIRIAALVHAAAKCGKPGQLIFLLTPIRDDLNFFGLKRFQSKMSLVSAKQSGSTSSNFP